MCEALDGDGDSVPVDAPVQKLAGRIEGGIGPSSFPAFAAGYLFEFSVFVCAQSWNGALHQVSLQLSATDVSARTTMKGAAKCDKHCELQNSVNQKVFERILRFRDIPESMPASVSIHFHSRNLHLPLAGAGKFLACVCVSECMCLHLPLTHLVDGDLCDKQLEERLHVLPCCLSARAYLNFVYPFSGRLLQDMKLGQQTR